MRLPGMDGDWELVTDFSVLKAGMIVACAPCAICNSSHRGIIIPGLPYAWDIAGDFHEGASFELLPAPDCKSVGFSAMVIMQRTVDGRRVYRLIDPALASTQTTAARKREPVGP